LDKTELTPRAAARAWRTRIGPAFHHEDHFGLFGAYIPLRTFLTAVTERRLTRAGACVLAYRRARGHWPADLAECGADDLLDPFSGRPFELEATPSGGVVVLGEASNGITQGAAWTYLGARVLYVPAYATGVYLLRSLIFAVGWLATLTMLLVALF